MVWEGILRFLRRRPSMLLALLVIYTIILLKSVEVGKLQVAILARSSREMSQTVLIAWKHILSQVRVSVRPSNFFIREKHKPSGNRIALACLFEWNSDAHCRQRSGPSRLGATDPSLTWKARRCVCVCASVHACVREVFWYDNNIWPRLIMMVIKIIILYFIQIRHIDDFPSTGTRLVLLICWFHCKSDVIVTPKHLAEYVSDQFWMWRVYTFNSLCFGRPTLKMKHLSILNCICHMNSHSAILFKSFCKRIVSSLFLMGR